MAAVESLTLVPSNYWFSLLYIYNRPKDYVARITIESQILYCQQFTDFPVRLFAADSDPKAGLIFIWKLSDRRYELMIFSLKEDKSKLIAALQNTKIIDWIRDLVFCDMTSDVQVAVKKVLDMKGYRNKIFTDTLVKLTKEKALLLNTALPAELSLDVLSLNSAEEVDKVYPHRYPGSLDYFQDMLKRKLALGLFRKTDGELLGWILKSLRGDLHTLFIKEKYRRKGYAELLIKVLSKSIAEQGINIFASIVENNQASVELFSKLQFDISENVYWLDE